MDQESQWPSSYSDSNGTPPGSVTDLSSLFGEQQNESELPPATDVRYEIEWEKERRDRLGRRICLLIDSYLAETGERRSQVEVYRDAWECMPDTQPQGPWLNSANITSDATRRVCNNHHTRLNQQILFASPPFTAVARNEMAQAAVPKIEEAVTSELDEADWRSYANLVHTELPLAGNVFLRITYEIETRRVPRIQVTWEPADAQALLDAGTDPLHAYYGGLRTDSQGRPLRRLDFRDILSYKGIRLKVIPWEDGVILPVSVRNWEDAYGIGERLILTGEQLRQGARDGRYIEEEVDELLRKDSDPPDPLQNRTWDHQGIRPGTAKPLPLNNDDDDDKLTREYLCYELCYRLDGNDDGQLEWCIVTVHKETKRVLRLQYLPWEHGQPHYVMFPYLERPGKLFGAGVAELMSCFQDADTAILNQLLDHGDLILNLHGNFFYDRSSGFDPAKHELKLGTPIPANDIGGILPIQIPPIGPEHYQLLNTLKDRIDLLTQTSNPSLGKETDTRKTLGEVQIVQSASNLQFEDVAGRVAMVWAKVFDQVRWLMAQFGTGGEVRYRRTLRPTLQIIGQGGDADQPMSPDQPAPSPLQTIEFDSVSVEDLLADVDIVPTGLQQLSDMQSRVSQATTIMQTLLQHPLSQPNVGVQLIALDTYLQALHYPQHDRIMRLIVQALQQQMAVQQAMAQQQQQAVQADQEGQMAAAETRAQVAAAQGGLLPAAGPPGPQVPPISPQEQVPFVATNGLAPAGAAG